MTVLVSDDSLSSSERALVALQIMRPEHLGAEQVGYINSQATPPRLNMMGGELCLNACRSMAALLYAEGSLPFSEPPEGIPAGEGVGWRYGWLQSSGSPEALCVAARPKMEHDPFLTPYDTGVCLRLNPWPAINPVASGMTLVRLPGICHVILNADEHPFPEDWRTVSAHVRRQLGLEHEEAVGCLWLDARTPSLTPVVWVRDTNEAHYENACGSGTVACALFLFERHPDCVHPQSIHIVQAGGETLQVRLHRPRKDDKTVWLWLSGSAECVARGNVHVRITDRN